MSPKWPIARIWTSERFAELIKLIRQMENDPTRNPQGNRILWLGPNKTFPWFWTPRHALNDVDEEWYWRYYSSEFYVMDTFCDPKNETRESPDTLFLHDARQYFESGGRCHLLYWKMTPRPSNLASASKGRAIFQYMKDGDPRPVRPGAHMRSGWKVLHPTSLDDYDPYTCTIVTESARANQFRWNYRTHPDTLIPDLRQILADLPDGCQWYGSMQAEYEPIQGCPFWKRDKRQPWYTEFFKDKEVIPRRKAKDEDADEEHGNDDVDGEGAAQQALLEEIALAEQSDDEGDGDGEAEEHAYAQHEKQLTAIMARISSLDCGSDPDVVDLVNELKGCLDDSSTFQEHISDLSAHLNEFQQRLDQRNNCLEAVLRRANALGFSMDPQVQEPIHSATDSVATADTYTFDELLEVLSNLLDQRQDDAASKSKKQDLPGKWSGSEATTEQSNLRCYNCGLLLHNTEAIICTTPGHEGRKFHLHCVPSANNGDSGTWRCKDCSASGTDDRPKLMNLTFHKNSCYINSAIPLLRSIKPLFDVVQNPQKQVANLETGRHDREWLLEEVPQGASADEVASKLAMTMEASSSVVSALRKLFTRLTDGSRRVQTHEIDAFLVSPLGISL